MRFFRRGSGDGPSDDRGAPRDEPSAPGSDRADPAASSPWTARAATFVEIMGGLAASLALDYSPESLRALDDFISATFEGPSVSSAPESLQDDVGAYVGEVVRRHIGGRWDEDGSLRDLGGEVTQVHPIGKARKRFANGPEDSLAWFYEVVRRHAAGEA